RLHLYLCAVVALMLVFRLRQWPTAITPPRPVIEAARHPVVDIMAMLGGTVGLPFVLLAGNGTLAQAWLGRLKPTVNPYRYYALSNAGSLLALVSYPLLVEPFMPIRQQAHTWTAGLGIFLTTSILFCLQVLHRVNGSDRTGCKSAQPSEPPTNTAGTAQQWSLAFLLAVCASLLLAAVTNHICQDVAPVPLLWILPLAAYLLTFILSFSGKLELSENYTSGLAVAGTFMGWGAMHWEPRLGILLQIAMHTGALFLICIFCHNNLYKLRPSQTDLPFFYLVVALGGVAGSFLVAVVAPMCFNWFWEYPLGLVLVTALAGYLWYRKNHSLRNHYGLRGITWGAPALVLGFLLLYDGIMGFSGIVESKRNFYGVVRIHQQTKGLPPDTVIVSSLMHGKITHGMQPDRTAYRYRPTTYFTEASGIGMAILRFRELNPGRPLRMAVAGLGVGTLAAYGREGDYIRFYEINPVVISYATDGRFFSYLADTHARVDSIEGDARVMMQRDHDEGTTQKFDIVVLDAFSGDAVPVHLLTREAVALYLDLLAPDGVLAWNGTNRYLDFEPLARTMARQFGLAMAVIESSGDFKVSTPATWILLARDERFFLSEPFRARVVDTSTGRVVRIWTDDYSNLLSLLKRGGASSR
ncbi:MAG: fused MFS/spermidine synthase, partial [Kiritimatiellae bacterium]|nr:fused MFS/spermidine synthase [Kiritimatiellia bacterium]